MSHPSKSSGYIYVLTDCEAIFFKTALLLDDPKQEFIELQEYQARKSVQYSRFGHKHLFVAAGTDGVDVYNWNEDGTIKKFKTIGPQEFNKKEINIQDISYEEGILSALEPEGLHFFQIVSFDNIAKLDIVIPLYQAFTFGQFESKMYYIAEYDPNH